MKCYYPTDKSGNRIGFKTPEACIYDTSGTNLTNKLNKLRSDVNGKANASHGTHVPTPQTANNKIYLRNDNTWHTITPSDIGAAASSHSHSWDSITGKPSLYTTSQIDSKVSEINSNISDINGKLNLQKLVGVGTVQGLQFYNLASTTEKIYTCKNLDAGTIILAYLSFSGSSQLFTSMIIDTPTYLKYNEDCVVIHDSVNNQKGYIYRKSSTSIALKTSDNRWQLRVVIY